MRFKLTKKQLRSIGKVFAWSLSSALIGGGLYALQVGEFPKEVSAYIPMINTILYGALEFLKDNRPE